MATAQIATEDALRLVGRIQAITVAWMSVEAGLSLWSALRAHSPALFAFGADSAIELISALVVVWSFRHRSSGKDTRRAAQITGALLFVLAGFVVVVAALSLLGYSETKPSMVGIIVLVAAAIIMPWLAKEKRKLSSVTGSAALRADAAESAVCFYLSVIALLGVSVHALWHIHWADPMAALAITPFLVYEGREAIRGKPCACC